MIYNQILVIFQAKNVELFNSHFLYVYYIYINYILTTPIL